MIAPPGDPERSRLSVVCQNYAQVRYKGRFTYDVTESKAIKLFTLETVYKVAICLKGNIPYKQIYFTNGLKLLLNGILGQ